MITTEREAEDGIGTHEESKERKRRDSLQQVCDMTSELSQSLHNANKYQDSQ